MSFIYCYSIILNDIIFGIITRIVRDRDEEGNDMAIENLVVLLNPSFSHALDGVIHQICTILPFPTTLMSRPHFVPIPSLVSLVLHFFHDAVGPILEPDKLLAMSPEKIFFQLLKTWHAWRQGVVWADGRLGQIESCGFG